MAVYLITTRLMDESELSSLISEKYKEEDRCNLKNGTWLVYEEKKTLVPEIFTKVFGNEPSKTSTSFITDVDSYYGMQSDDVWNWLSSKTL